MEFTISQVGERTGISADTLRYYEKEGMLAPKRGANGYRYYDETDILTLKYIVVMKNARFSLADIKSMVALFGIEPSAQCNEIARRILNKKIAELKRTICNYQKTISLMEGFLLMAEGIDAYVANEERIHGFIGQLFDDIQSGALFAPDAQDQPTERGGQ